MSKKRVAARALLRAVAIRMQNFVGERGGQFSHYAQAIQMREICFELAKSLMLLLRAFAFRHIDVRGDYLDSSPSAENKGRRSIRYI